MISFLSICRPFQIRPDLAYDLFFHGKAGRHRNRPATSRRIRQLLPGARHPASLQILADRNTLDYMHYETLMFALTHLFSRLKEEMRIEKG